MSRPIVKKSMAASARHDWNARAMREQPAVPYSSNRKSRNEIDWVRELVEDKQRGRGASSPQIKRASGITLGKVVGIMLVVIAIACAVSAHLQ